MGNLRIRIDLKILIFLIIFYFSNQIEAYLVVMFFSIIHEIGHIITGIILKMKPQKLEIMPFGLCVSFYTNYDDKNFNIKEIFVALGGPITSLILALLSSMKESVYSNLLILFFNLIPLYPLDGGRILKGILHMKMGIIETEKLVSKISSITMIVLTVISSIAVYYYKNIAIFLICIFLWSIVLREKKTKHLIFCGENSKIDVKERQV